MQIIHLKATVVAPGVCVFSGPCVICVRGAENDKNPSCRPEGLIEKGGSGFEWLLIRLNEWVNVMSWAWNDFIDWDPEVAVYLTHSSGKVPSSHST